MASVLALPAPRISEGARRLNLNLAQRRAPDGADGVFLLKDVFTTIDGSWEPSGHPYSIPQWARDLYLRPFGAPDYFDDAGGAQHLFARLEDENGKVLAYSVRYWTADGNNLEIRSTGDKKSGWANLPIYAAFVPERGERGPWNYAPMGRCIQWVEGAGLPSKQHVSIFAVWQLYNLPSTPTPQPTNQTVIDVSVTQPNTLVRIHAAQSYQIEVDYAIQY